MSQHSYNIYPTLLDAFQRYLDADKTFEDYGNDDGQGGYKRTLEEISAELEQRLLDTINRTEREPAEAADKGTCFNALVDWLRGYPSAIPIEYRSDEIDGQACTYYEMSLNGFTFRFDWEMAENAARYYDGAIPQLRCSAPLATRYGDVWLYGYIDEICRDEVKDIKTTSRYQFGKYEHYWQREVYPYCLITSGKMDNVSAFEFSVFVWRDRVGMPTSATMYKEVYTYDYERSTIKLRHICERFIEWLEANRERITDNKIFGGE